MAARKKNATEGIVCERQSSRRLVHDIKEGVGGGKDIAAARSSVGSGLGPEMNGVIGKIIAGNSNGVRACNASAGLVLSKGVTSNRSVKGIVVNDGVPGLTSSKLNAVVVRWRPPAVPKEVMDIVVLDDNTCIGLDVDAIFHVRNVVAPGRAPRSRAELDALSPKKSAIDRIVVDNGPCVAIGDEDVWALATLNSYVVILDDDAAPSHVLCGNRLSIR